MSYRVKEIFPTLQGEGAHAGRAAVFCRFTGCNLWSGREEHRATAVCRFCDTDFVGTDGPGGGAFAGAADLADAVARTWRGAMGEGGRPYVVCTGGEPLLQLDGALVDALHAAASRSPSRPTAPSPCPTGSTGCASAPRPAPTWWSPRATSSSWCSRRRAPSPCRYEHLAFDRWFLQPMDVAGPRGHRANTAAAVAYCLAHPQWRLSVQTHKYLGIP